MLKDSIFRLKDSLLTVLLTGCLGLVGVIVFEIHPFIIIVLMMIIQMISNIGFFLRAQKDKIRMSDELKSRLRRSDKDSSLKNKQMQHMMAAIPFPIFLLDLYGTITLVNSHCDQFRKREMKKEETYLSNGFIDELTEFFKEAYILEKALNKVMSIQGVEYNVVSVPLENKGKFNGCLILLQDISETLKGEKQQKRFIADASHELKTPISIIKGMIEILTREGFDDEATRVDFLQQIKTENERLEVIVKDMLLLSKMSSDHLLLQRELYDIHEIIDKALQPFLGLFANKHIQIIKDYQYHERCFVDRDKFIQVFTNLFQNAHAYTDTGYLKISTKEHNGGCLLQISDSGCGIEEEHLEQVFERLFRVDSSRARESGGSGLGLAITKSIVEAHNGTIWVNSKFGEGSTFSIQLKL
ncbi:MAG: sensor histidine kinase [Erysipelotrichaceae bacterium]